MAGNTSQDAGVFVAFSVNFIALSLGEKSLLIISTMILFNL